MFNKKTRSLEVEYVIKKYNTPNVKKITSS